MGHHKYSNDSFETNVLTDDPLEAVINQRYHDLWLAIVIRAVMDYVDAKPAFGKKFKYDISDRSSRDTIFYSAKRFLSDQQNIDLTGLNLTTEDVFEALDKLSPDDMKLRTRQYFMSDGD